MTDPAPKPIADCPNPECDSHNYTDAIEDSFGVFQNNGSKLWHVNCDVCGYSGPEAKTAEEAERLHNLLCRPSRRDGCGQNS